MIRSVELETSAGEGGIMNPLNSYRWIILIAIEYSENGEKFAKVFSPFFHVIINKTVIFSDLLNMQIINWIVKTGGPRHR